MALIALITLCGCQSRSEQPPESRIVTRGLEATDRYVQDEVGPPPAPDGPVGPAQRPVAIVDGRPIPLDALRGPLIEAGGGQVLEEAVLDELLQREAERRGVSVSPRDVEAERDRLVRTLTGSGAASDPSQAGRILANLRASRGLGDQRFAALLRRNALLRALVAPEVTLTPQVLDQAYAMRYGERFRARLITLPSASEAGDVLKRAKAGESFSTLAAQLSTDVSAARGGLLEPISPLDPAYPAAVRTALRALKPGQISDPIAIETGYALLELIEAVPAPSPAPERAGVEEELVQAVRLEQERMLMNQLAKRLLDSGRVTITDRVWDRAWRARTRRE